MSKPKKKKYTDKEKVEAILILKENGFNFSQTSKQLGLNTNTLKGWYNKFGYRITQEIDNNDQVQETVQEYAEEKDNFLRDVYDTKKETLDVVRQKVYQLNSTENIENMSPKFFSSLINMLKVLNELEKGSDPDAESDQKKAEGNNRKLQLIQNQIINVQNNGGNNADPTQ